MAFYFQYLSNQSRILSSLPFRHLIFSSDDKQLHFHALKVYWDWSSLQTANGSHLHISLIKIPAKGSAVYRSKKDLTSLVKSGVYLLSPRFPVLDRTQNCLWVLLVDDLISTLQPLSHGSNFSTLFQLYPGKWSEKAPFLISISLDVYRSVALDYYKIESPLFLPYSKCKNEFSFRVHPNELLFCGTNFRLWISLYILILTSSS